MRPMPELEVVSVNTGELLEYQSNAKLHPSEQVDQIAASIEEFGFNSPILAWHNDEGEPEIVAGHGRLMAARKLGIEELPVVFLDHMDDEQRRAYILIDNQLTMNSGFDFGMLDVEIGRITDIDMGQFGFDVISDPSEMTEDDGEKYSQKITTPVYEVSGECPDVDELCDTSTYDRLVEAIGRANVEGGIREFLLLAATRHITFDYGKVAEFYAHQGREVQELMEQSTLVIVDFDKAIEMGCVKAAVELMALRGADVEDE